MKDPDPYKDSNVVPIRENLSENIPKPGLKSSDGGGTFDGMEARVAKLEASLEHIGREISDVKADVRILRENARGDFRILFGAIIAVALGLAGLLAKGFHWL